MTKDFTWPCRYRLVYTVDLSEDESQTSYDAMHSAIWRMKEDLDNADSNDDLADVFEETEFE